MRTIFRLLCVCVGVTIMVAVQIHGVTNGQHKIEHGIQFPGIPYETAADPHHDDLGDNHAHGHDHDQQVDVDRISTLMSVDTADEKGHSPVGHHHHIGGDIHIALASPVYPTDASTIATLRLGPAPDALPPGALLDAPFQPPRQNA